MIKVFDFLFLGGYALVAVGALSMALAIILAVVWGLIEKAVGE